MSQLLVYTGALFAAWAAMGAFCLRSDAIRSRLRWPGFSAEDKQRYAFGAVLLCLLSLGMLWLAVQPSYALILWVLLHGVLGMAIAFGLPYASRALSQSFAVAAAASLCSLCVLFVFGA
ncbi:MAG: hypothetical protein KGL40_03955 [Rhodocyclaceae bacterium]|nr:hypothetical protein [Rhodocyclaceae bacterium]